MLIQMQWDINTPQSGFWIVINMLEIPDNVFKEFLKGMGMVEPGEKDVLEIEWNHIDECWVLGKRCYN